jgi:hypothetical protein
MPLRRGKVTHLKMRESGVPCEQYCTLQGRRRLLSWQLHCEAQEPELVDQALGSRLWIEALEVVLAELLIGLATGDDMVDDHEQRMGERHNRLLVPPPSSDASITSGQSRVFGVGGRLRGLDEEGPQLGVALAGAAAALPARALVMPRRQARPGGERRG